MDLFFSFWMRGMLVDGVFPHILLYEKHCVFFFWQATLAFCQSNDGSSTSDSTMSLNRASTKFAMDMILLELHTSTTISGKAGETFWMQKC